MGTPVVIATNGLGVPVVVSSGGFGVPLTVATNGYGMPVVQSTNGVGMAVTGITFGPAAPAAPILTLTSGASDTTPDFTLVGDLALGDTVRFQYSTSSGFAGASELTNTIDAAEDTANSINFTTGALAVNTWYFRARIERPVSGNSSWSNVETITLSSVDAATTAWVNAVIAGGGTVSATQQGRVDALIIGLKADGLFALMDGLWLHAGESVAKQATIDIKALRVAVPVNAPTLAAGGYTGNGTSSYINTNFTAFSNYTQNSASYGCYCRTSSTASGFECPMGMANGTVFSDLTPIVGGNVIARTNRTGGAQATGPNANRMGFYVAVCSDANNQQIYKNGNTTPVGTNNTGAQVVPALAFFIGARNDSGSPSSFAVDQVAVSFIGAGLSAAQQASLSARVNAYMTAWGINVY